MPKQFIRERTALKDDEESTEFGKRLRRAREQAHLTVGKLAQNVGLTEGAIRQMERGLTKNAVLPNGLEIAHVLGVSPWWLVGKDEPSGDRRASRAAIPTQAAGSDEAIVAAVLSRLGDPDDDVLDALQTRLKPYVAEVARLIVKSALLAAANASGER
jgi:transcriptional regulator with XRE-family HTH domain